MPTRNISLTAEHDAFVDQVVKSGEYQNASEAIRDALRALKQKRKEDELRLKLLRAELRAGLEALERGDFIEIGGEELQDYFAGLIPSPGKRSR